jgi:DNA-binding response OmpR family regulator
MRVLVVEDDEKTRRFLLRGLTESGFDAEGSPDGEDGLMLVTTRSYDVVLLDIMMPKRDGQSMLNEMRSQGIETPVIMLTAKEGLSDRVSGLDTGADDYLVKPVSFDELVARVQAVARRCLPEDAQDLRYDDLLLRAGANSVWREETEIGLSEIECRTLRVLMKFAGEGLSQRFISEQVLGGDEDWRSLDEVMTSLRHRVDDAFDHKHIHQIEGLGYVLR